VVERVEVFMERSEFPDKFVESMNLLGEQLGAPSITDGSRPTPSEGFQLKWNQGSSEEEGLGCISVGYGSLGVFLDGSDIGDSVNVVYEPAVATLAACLVWSEILRRSRAYQPVEIPKVSVSVNVRVNENALRNYVPNLDFTLEGHKVHQNTRESDDGTGHKRVLLRLDDNDPLVRALMEKLSVQLPNECIEPRAPALPFSLPPLDSEISGHLSIVGAGGLGTWCLHTLVEGLKEAEETDLKFVVFDKDLEIEDHNLNRQVIYGPSDVGSSKIFATRRWLEQRLPDAHIDTVYELTDAMAQPAERASEDGINLDELFPPEPDAILHGDEPLSVQASIEELEATDLILGCLDAMRPRVLANCIAAMKGIPYVNGGVRAFEGEFRQFTSESLVDLYGANAAQDTTVMSCQEDGAVPLTSMVLTNAFVGSFQALAALQRLSGFPSSSIQSAYWNAYENTVILHQEGDHPVQRASVEVLRKALWPNEVFS
jgi:molybdopterin/thiamine biosynthesis adenylyltransferase